MRRTPVAATAVAAVAALTIASAAMAYDLDKKAPGPKVPGKRVGASDCKTQHWERLVWKRKTDIGPRGLTIERVVPSHTEPCYVPPPPAPEPVLDPEPTPDTTSTPEVAAPTYSGGVSNATVMCESGGDYGANTGNGYYGGYQFDSQTWDAYGDPAYGEANEAPPGVQDQAAASVPYDAWPNC